MSHPIASVAAALLLAVTVSPVAANERTVGTIIGAGVGGAVGGVKGAVVGGVAGNVVGAVVKNERKKARSAQAAAAAPAETSVPEAAKDPANIEPPIEDVVAEAAPVLHYTCRSIVAAHGDDSAAIDADIRKMVALSVANRGIDLSDPPLSDETREEIRAEFADEIGDRCARDADAALFGVVDNVVAELALIYR